MEEKIRKLLSRHVFCFISEKVIGFYSRLFTESLKRKPRIGSNRSFLDSLWWTAHWKRHLRGCLHENTRTTKSFILGSLLDFVSRLDVDWVISRSGTTTGVNSRRCDSHRHDSLWWYHVNKYRATRGNWSELVLARKSSQCHVDSNTPWSWSLPLRWTPH